MVHPDRAGLALMLDMAAATCLAGGVESRRLLAQLPGRGRMTGDARGGLHTFRRRMAGFARIGQ